MKTFSEYAHEKMMDLFHNHSHEVGSVLKKRDPERYRDHEATDCITYALRVIGHAFKKTGNEAAAARAWGLGKHGTELARFLVTDHGWKGIYINPDSAHPIDADQEHSYTSHMAKKTRRYYKIPLEHRVHNYNVTPDSHPAFQKLNKNAGPSTLNEADIAGLERVKFGFGVSRGGRHTWLFSEGKVYETHWNKIGPDLYEASPLRKFPWLSGAIVTPSEQSQCLAETSRLFGAGEEAAIV
ncbi:conserved hypothetical protein [Candidatus Desulfarcum epimagneticum]|uniref:Uncharacterized protein n=1 Tax=uncultured Desulfobacteraceae bacterium TaxID=218296 RepID=A0A484HIW1_9BACT|nr:conserved hypothetical protein [uncultured Desulfobacteraceae bacterium]